MTSIRIWLDPHSPVTNFLLGVCLGGGDVRAFAAQFAADLEHRTHAEGSE
jgi:hypothetical protein